MKQDDPGSRDIPASEAQDSCKNCGTCCLKGGPAFHKEDKELLESGRISMADVYTIREGEPIYDNVKDVTLFADTDIIKIKGVQRTWSCRFLDQATNNCQIYKDRPIECQALKCWDTRDIESIYQANRLTRKDLVSGVEGLWELIEDHHEKCSYHLLRSFLKDRGKAPDEKSTERILEMIKYDLAIRPMMVEKGLLDPEILDFLLGRPLIETISMFGLEVVKEGDGYCLELKKTTSKDRNS